MQAETEDLPELTYINISQHLSEVTKSKQTLM